VPLTEQQQAALPALEWIFGGSRRTGRTTAMAIAMIRVACRNPGSSLYLVDHANFSRDMLHHLELVIRRLIDAAPLPDYASYNLFRGDRLVVNSPTPFNWEPDVEELGERPIGPPNLEGVVSPRELEIQRVQAQEDQRLLGSQPFTTRTIRGFDRATQLRIFAALDAVAQSPPPKPALQRISEEEDVV